MVKKNPGPFVFVDIVTNVLRSSVMRDVERKKRRKEKMSKKQIAVILAIIIFLCSTIAYALAEEINFSNQTEFNISENPLSFQDQLIQANFGMQKQLEDCKAKLKSNYVLYFAILLAVVCVADRVYFRFRKEK